MSTRATYSFESEHACARSVTLYIHHDGYPAGAAWYFYQSLNADVCGSLAERTLRAVPNSELTESHGTHGDTEYRYHVQGHGAGATVKSEARTGWDSETWRLVWHGTLAEFIKKHRDAEWWAGEPEYSAFREVAGGVGRSEWHNATTARRAIDSSSSSALPTLRIWAENGACPTTSANWQSVAGRVLALAEAFGFDDVTEEVERLSADPAEVVGLAILNGGAQ